MSFRAILFAAFFALPAWAQSPMTGAEFDAYTQGRTLYYAANGMRYGVEKYLPNRRVRWSFLDGECKEGGWYESGSQICFAYDDGSPHQCWEFFRTDKGLRARFAEDPAGDELYEVAGEGEMTCLGPEVGV